MTRHEELLEKYTDAYFALLIEEVSIDEGSRLDRVNEMLRQYPNVAVPEALNQRCIQIIDRYFAVQRRQKTLQSLKKVMYRVAVLVMIASTLFTTAYAFSESFRMLIGRFGTHAQLRLEAPVTIKNTATPYDISAEWLPDGYVFTEERRSSQSIWKQYAAADARLIEVSTYIDPNVTISLDSEDAEVKPLEIQGKSALMIEKEGDVQIAWVDPETGVLWEIFGEGIAETTIIQVAEHVILK